jgi:hypothetical protein
VDINDAPSGYQRDALGNFQPRRPSRTFRKKSGVAGIVSLGIVVTIIATVAAPVIVMLGTGYLHGFYPVVPAMGFWQSLVAVWVARALLGTSTFIRKES